MEGIWSLLELEEQRDAAVEWYATMELEWREAERRSQKAHARMDELTEKLAAFCTRRNRWIRFLQGRIRVGASTSRGVANEERLLRRVVAKGNTLAGAVKEEKEEARCARVEVRELERELELAA